MKIYIEKYLTIKKAVTDSIPVDAVVKVIEKILALKEDPANFVLAMYIALMLASLVTDPEKVLPIKTYRRFRCPHSPII